MLTPHPAAQENDSIVCSLCLGPDTQPVSLNPLDLFLRQLIKTKIHRDTSAPKSTLNDHMKTTWSLCHQELTYSGQRRGNFDVCFPESVSFILPEIDGGRCFPAGIIHSSPFLVSLLLTLEMVPQFGIARWDQMLAPRYQSQ